ncbi:M20 family metallopeptidase [Chloroflexota bacterium]
MLKLEILVILSYNKHCWDYNWRTVFSVGRKLNVEELKASITGEIDNQRHRLSQLSLKIHANPELGFHEVKAATWSTEYLEENGFSVERGICGLPTAFRGIYGQEKPAVAILAEYDALPCIGHACGHNIIATSAVGAAVASKLAIDRFGGSILVLGTPAEETYGGKAVMADRGGFNDVDMAMMIHPGVHSTATIRALANQNLEVEFFGRAVHAAARPEVGINALEAMLNSFAAINSLRQHIKSTARIHGIITDGGEAANIVPAHSAGSFIVRAEDYAYLEELKDKVLNCFVGAATASGARLKYKWGEVRYAPMRNNLTMARLFQQNMQSLERRMQLSNPNSAFGSTDMGNVSQLVPSIHPIVAIAPMDVMGHSPQFAEAAASEAGIRGLVDGAKALAMTVADLLSNPEVVSKVKKEFQQQK